MTECYECAKLAELVAENNQLRGKVDELNRNGWKAAQDMDNGENVHMCPNDTREKLEADLQSLTEKWHDYDGNYMRIYSSVAYAQVKELLDRQAAITEREFIDTECMKCAKADKERESDYSEILAKRDDVIAVLKAESAELEAERDQWRDAAGNAHAMCEKADNERNELKSKVDELTAEIDALEYVGALGEQIGRCKACKFAGIHDGKRWPGREFKGRMYCIAWSDGYMAEWTKPDGFCHMWKPKEGEE